MTEYLEDEYEDEYEDWDESEDDETLYDEIDELRDQIEEQAINQTIRAMENAHGSRFSPEEAQEIGELLDQGFDPESVYEHVQPTSTDDQAFINRYADNVQRIEAEKGRSLSEPETDRIWEKAVERGDPTHVDEKAVYDTSTREGRIGLMSDRFDETNQPQTEQFDYVEKPAAGASKAERIEYMTERMSGAEAVDTDTYEGDE